METTTYEAMQFPDGPRVVGVGGEDRVLLGMVCTAGSQDWAQRIAACLNACAVYTTEAIVAGKVKMQPDLVALAPVLATCSTVPVPKKVHIKLAGIGE